MKPYAGAPVSRVFRERWLSGKHIGPAKPVGMVEVRRGRLVRHMHPFPGLGYPVFGEYPGALSDGFWYPDWQVNSDWVALDGVQNIKLDQSFDQNGVQTCTIKMDNQALVPTTGHAGILYHVVEQGYYSPLRGYEAPHRPRAGLTKTPFFQHLPYAQIRVRQGYGADEMVTTFLGLIDDIDTASKPNELTITARDFGGVLVDELFFGWAKEKALFPPVTFAPRNLAENHRLVGGGARASSRFAGYDENNVLGEDSGVDWRSDTHDSPDHTEWIEIKLPEGKYSQIFLRTPFEGMHAYIGLKPTIRTDLNDGHGTDPTYDGQSIPLGWFDPNGNTVPGGHGGWAYFAEIPATHGGKGHYISLGGVFYVGDETILRVGFRNLGAIDDGYAAEVTRLAGNRRRFKEATIEGLYIVIDDVAEIVKCCLRWCGFKGWEVENTGVNLLEPYATDATTTFMDAINKVKDMTGFTFFIGEPRDDTDDQDLGYPIFRNNRVMENRTGKTEFIDDKLLLTDAKVKFTNKDDRTIIRARGVARKDGVPIGGDTVRRIMFAYHPPWSGEQAHKAAGVIKPLTHTDHLFTKLSDCQFACYLIALQMGLSRYTAVIDLPANPGIGLDTLQSVLDRVQGFNSRIYISNRSQEMQFGRDGFWTMELGGGLVDTPEVTKILKDFKKAIRVLDRGGRNPWLRKRHGKPIPYGYQDA